MRDSDHNGDTIFGADNRLYAKTDDMIGPGDSCSLADLYFGHPYVTDNPDFTFLGWSLGDHCAWSDYTGTTANRSNYYVLLDKFREHLVRVHGAYNLHSLVIPASLETTHPDVWAEITKAWTHLEEYPVLDDEALLVLEWSLYHDAWGMWLKYDVMSALDDRGVDIDTIDEGQVKACFYAINDDTNEPFAFDDAITCTIPDFDDVLDILANHCKVECSDPKQ